MFVELKDRAPAAADHRGDPAAAPRQAAQFRAAVLRAADPELTPAAAQTRTLYLYTLQGLRLDELYDWAQQHGTAAAPDPGLQDVNTDLQIDAPVVQVDGGRRQRTSHGRLAVDQVRQALFSAFGARQISTLYGQANAYPVILEACPRTSGTRPASAKLYLRAMTGRLVPLSCGGDASSAITGPLNVAHQGQLPAVAIGFNAAPGVPLGDAANAIRQPSTQEIGLPPTVVTGFSGAAQVFQQALAGQGAA
jgi:HAE1 family hydrophobic/amphiphilic exporter-1